MSHSARTASAYHRLTGYRRGRLTPHALDWAHQPRPRKPYPQLDRIPFPTDLSMPEMDYADLVRQAAQSVSAPQTDLDLNTLAALFHLTHAVTARSMHGDQPFYYRSIASAGALYPFEMYLAVHDVQGVAAGVYHYDLFDFALTRLREGAVPMMPSSVRRVAATIYISGIFFRSAWKYRSRAYRYVLLDAGHLLENLRLALTALGLGFCVHTDFDDARVAALLGLDEGREGGLVCVHLFSNEGGKGRLAPVADPSPLPNDIRDASRVSAREVTYAEIQEIHHAGYGAAPTATGRERQPVSPGWHPRAWIDLPPSSPAGHTDYARLLWQRRSRRNFVSQSISMDHLAAFLDPMATSVAGTCMPTGEIVAIGLLAGAGMPVSPGAYLFDPHGRRLGQLAGGAMLESMARACLDQMWLKNAAFHLLFVSDPKALDQAWGARGYRYAMLEAGRLGQQAYLAATALGWGACGIGAIYDREAADLLGLTRDGALLYLVGIGPLKGR
ncbi:hypothetical protein DSCO28_52730 [Desulfosarcina ovata subsp. sediminis]|uniref:Nitroreductase domain-containing protein n=1 Tax=Desulfosarcina ovata subsp. sediminis TaxID=885957 RepID=A0A5K7ZWR4_9BACT|nr:SagB/ThcOx family dehydrogenase [Desulfosarcina ovata]BBO84707.1 hypothetical protein DSCO28_52730 [Desulfosarcina ovata subsp. sediminis]